MSSGSAITVSMDQLFVDEEFNCRGAIVAVDVVDLAKDIDQRGLIQPVTVAPTDKTTEDGRPMYKLIAGFRRQMAHRVLKKKRIFCVVRADMADAIAARCFNLAENIQRKDLDVLQEALAIGHLYKLGLGEHDVAKKLGKSRGWVQVRFMLLQLPEEIQQEAAAGVLRQRNIREVYAIYKAAGKEPAFDAVKQLKDARLLGKKRQNLSAKKRNPLKKGIQSRAAMFAMQSLVYDHIGNGMVTRVLAWCAGEINDVTFLDSLEEHCRQQDIIFRRPKDNLIITGASSHQ
jgi:ParB/RepB/Spo0J family partition protein